MICTRLRLILNQHVHAFAHVEAFYLVQTLPSVLLRTIQKTATGIRVGLQGKTDLDSPKSRPKTIVPYKDWRILIAEDNQVNQKVLQRLLKKLGIDNVDIASNGKIAVDMEKETKYDLILMDLQMPEMDGMEACQAILNPNSISTGKEVPMVVFVTAHVSSDYEKACREAGGIDFLAKPVNFQALESLFQSLASRQNNSRD